MLKLMKALCGLAAVLAVVMAAIFAARSVLTGKAPHTIAEKLRRFFDYTPATLTEEF